MSTPAYTKTISIRSTASSTWHNLPANNGTLNLAGDLLDDTDITSTGYRSKTIGLRDWSISAPSYYDSANTALIVARNAWMNRTRISMRYLPNGSVGFTGIGYIETFTLSGDVGGLETVDISIQADGALSTA